MITVTRKIQLSSVADGLQDVYVISCEGGSLEIPLDEVITHNVPAEK